ncbi:hypothetical protein N431DRAFT_75387 [Stipitochalara longipes BDJ]|nr:hypothetical protein N431DRAFT_75387 [Stipitochalara longipes BDJ]
MDTTEGHDRKTRLAKQCAFNFAVQPCPRKHCAQSVLRSGSRGQKRKLEKVVSVPFCCSSSSKAKSSAGKLPCTEADMQKRSALPHHITTHLVHHISQTPSRRMIPGSLFPSSHPIAFSLSHPPSPQPIPRANLPTRAEVMTPSPNGLVSLRFEALSGMAQVGCAKMWWRFLILSDHLKVWKWGEGRQ